MPTNPESVLAKCPPKVPDYTCTFAEVYLAELDYVKKRRDKIDIPSDAVVKECERVREELQTQKLRNEETQMSQTGVLGFLDRFRAWFWLAGLLLVTILGVRYIDTPTPWHSLLFIVAWFFWFLLFLICHLETTEPFNPQDSIKPSTNTGLVGLALSGGGVRSATFNLGLLQSLAKNKVLQYCDYLSTVSGGGYIGSCLSSLLANEHNAEGSTKLEAFPLAEGSDEVKHLRGKANYLNFGNSLFNWNTWYHIGTIFFGVVLINIVPLAIILLIPTILLLVNYSFFPFFHYLSALMDNRWWIWLVVAALFIGGTMIRSRQWSPYSRFSQLLTEVRKNIIFFLLLFVIVVLGIRVLEWMQMPFDALVFGLVGLTVVSLWVIIRLFYRVVFLVLRKVPEYDSKWCHSNNKKIALISASLVLLISIILIMPNKMYAFWFAVLSLVVGYFIAVQGKLQRLFTKQIMSVALIVMLITSSLWLLSVLDNFYKLAEEHVDLALNLMIVTDGNNTVSELVAQVRQVKPMVILVMMCVPIVVLLLIGFMFINLNYTSLHYFYRDRLSGAYLIRRKQGETTVEENQSLQLQKLHTSYNGPYHLVNTTLNVPSNKARCAELFIFSKHYCGAEATGYKRTGKYQKGETTLATTMAISGAAVSPVMGDISTSIGGILTLLNLRLHLWMPNPKCRRLPPTIWPYYLYKEMFHKGQENDALLNLSDGGHYENLGIYSLLKRRCRLIIASDAAADPDYRMEDIKKLKKKAHEDLEIDIDLDLNDLRPNDNRHTKAYFVKGTIRYPEGETGTLFYIKTTMTGKETGPEELLDYLRVNSQFPDETTADQFFTEEQFDAYRQLGELVGKELCSKKAGKEMCEIKEKIEQLF